MATSSQLNGKPQRKQLSEQLDRFDAMLDGLSEGLSDVIAEAARSGTRLAVKDAIVEILTDPQLRSQLHQATATSPDTADAKPSVWSRLKAGVRGIWNVIAGSAKATTEVTVRATKRAGTLLHDPLQIVGMLGSLKRLLMLGTGVGAVVAVLSYVAPHFLSAVVSGAGAAVTAMAVQLGFWARRNFPRLTVS